MVDCTTRDAWLAFQIDWLTKPVRATLATRSNRLGDQVPTCTTGYLFESIGRSKPAYTVWLPIQIDWSTKLVHAALARFSNRLADHTHTDAALSLASVPAQTAEPSIEDPPPRTTPGALSWALFRGDPSIPGHNQAPPLGCIDRVLCTATTRGRDSVGSSRLWLSRHAAVSCTLP